MPARHNLPITAERLLHDLSAQLEHFSKFLEVALTPAIAETRVTSDVPIESDFILRRRQDARLLDACFIVCATSIRLGLAWLGISSKD